MPLTSIWHQSSDGSWIAKLVDCTPLAQAPIAREPSRFRRRTVTNLEAKRARRTDYKELCFWFGAYPNKLDSEERQRKEEMHSLNASHRQAMDALTARINSKWHAYQRSSTLSQCALDLCDDHDFIAAMFRLYSQQRSRIL